MSIHPQSFTISKQEFFDQPLTQLTSGGVKYTRALLAARGSATCSMVQTCQVNWTIKIPANTLAIQLNKVPTATINSDLTANPAVNFNGKVGSTADPTDNMTQGPQGYALTEVLRFWLGFSTACGPFNQFAICNDSTKLWDTSIYAREQAVICSNSLSDLCTNNSVSVSPLESIIQGKRHCGVFIDVALSDINTRSATNEWYYPMPDDIVFSGVLDLNQLNPIFNSFPVLTRNYASLYLQLWMQDFLQDLKVVWLNKTDTVANRHLAYQMIPPEKPDIIYLLKAAIAGEVFSYGKFSARIVNIQGAAVDAKVPQNTISQIKDASFTKLEIQNAMFMTFAIPQYPTWFFPVLFHNFDLVIDQRHVIPQPYEALTQAVCGQMFDCFVDQDVVSAPSDFGTRAYPDPVEVGLTPITHYLCDAIVQIMFDDNPDPQVLSLEVIGEMGGSMVRNE
ncbi:MAG: hypothetical protein EZS28_025553 [Streblomastix strix]|uniref:Uncharacterized protein n=1 Tax=Streblomastix strix TaxID=222440 RepID=A0A5J4V8V4_9EUKA|nr:MAG: hypothetical protein EZS28_025553 [Streblomastix strix]